MAGCPLTQGPRARAEAGSGVVSAVLPRRGREAGHTPQRKACVLGSWPRATVGGEGWQLAPPGADGETEAPRVTLAVTPWAARARRTLGAVPGPSPALPRGFWVWEKQSPVYLSR